MSLKSLISDGAVGIATITEYLDTLSYPARLAETRSLERGDQARLYEKAAGSPPITLEHFVPADRNPAAPVVHQGKNSLPVFSTFQKIFARPDDGSARLFGYNEGFTRPVIGPGYFVAHTTAGNPEWESRGAVVVDYFQVPDRPVPHGWPRVVPNSVGPQVLVFFHTRDFMRRVSRDVSIGAAYKNERKMGAYFVLCREP
ncbi:MAG: hypothetical protein ACYC8T_21410 [Myxococcaceae bacterium]